MRKFINPILIFIVAVVVNLPSLNYSSINFDDDSIVFDQIEFWQAPVDIEAVMTTDTYVFSVSNYYRPLNSLSYYLEPHIYGSVSPTAYHITNTLLFALIALLVWQILLKSGVDRRAALLSTFLYAVHPIFTPAVAWIASRDYLLMTLFSAAAWVVFLDYSKKPTLLRVGIITLLFILGIGCKESTVALIPLIALYLVATKNRAKLKLHISLLTSLVVVTLGFLVARYFVLPHSELAIHLDDEKTNYLLVAWRNIIAQIDNLSQLIAPFDYSLKVETSALKIVLGAIVALSLAVYAIYGKWRTPLERWFYALWFFIALSPTLIVKMLHFDYLAHRLLFPAIGIFVLVGGLLTNVKREKLVTIVVVVLCALLAIINIDRAKIFENEDVFIKFHYDHSNHSVKSASAYASLLSRKGDMQKALTVVNEEKLLHVNDYDLLNTRAEIFTKIGRKEEALAQLQRVDSALLARHWAITKNLGIAYFDLKTYDKAIEILQLALERFEEHYIGVKYRNKLSNERNVINLMKARSYMGLGDNEKALEAINQCGDFLNAMPHKVIILSNLGRNEEALSLITSYIKARPTDRQALIMQRQLILRLKQ